MLEFSWLIILQLMWYRWTNDQLRPHAWMIHFCCSHLNSYNFLNSSNCFRGDNHYSRVSMQICTMRCFFYIDYYIDAIIFAYFGSIYISINIELVRWVSGQTKYLSSEGIDWWAHACITINRSAIIIFTRATHALFHTWWWVFAIIITITSIFLMKFSRGDRIYTICVSLPTYFDGVSL